MNIKEYSEQLFLSLGVFKSNNSNQDYYQLLLDTREYITSSRFNVVGRYVTNQYFWGGVSYTYQSKAFINLQQKLDDLIGLATKEISETAIGWKEYLSGFGDKIMGAGVIIAQNVISILKNNPKTAIVGLVYAQHAAASALRNDYFGNVTKVGEEFRVNNESMSYQYELALTRLSENNFAVAWRDSYAQYGVYGQVFDISDGYADTVGSKFMLHTASPWRQRNPLLTYLSAESLFVATWRDEESLGNGLYGVYGQVFNFNGTHVIRVGEEFSTYDVTAVVDEQNNYHAVDAISSDTFVVTWFRNYDSADGRIYAQALHFDGAAVTRVGDACLVNTPYLSHKSSLAIAKLSAESFVITWTSLESSEEVYCQALKFNGTSISRIGNEVKVNDYENLAQSNSAVTSLSEDVFVVTWDSEAQDDGVYQGVVARILNFNGTAVNKVGEEFIVNTNMDYGQNGPAIDSLSTDSFVISWESYQEFNDADAGLSYGVYGQIYNFNGTVSSKVSNEFRANNYTIGDQFRSALVGISSDTFVVTWVSSEQDVHLGGYGQVFSTIATTLINNRLVVNEGATVSVSLLNFDAEDSEYNADDLTFYIEGLQNGRFVYNNDTDTPVASFSRKAVREDLISFVHTVGDDAPRYSVSVSNGRYATRAYAADVMFNYLPRFVNNRLFVSENTSVIVSLDNINGTDPDNNDADLLFSVSDLVRGYFTLAGDLDTSITNFSLAAISANQVSFVPLGKEAPSYSLSISDINITTTEEPASIDFNHAPNIVSNSFSVRSGENFIFSTENMQATDIETDDAQLIFRVQEVVNGYFSRVDLNFPVNNFVQQDIINRAIMFVSDNSGNTPTAILVAEDELGILSLPSASDINFSGARGFDIGGAGGGSNGGAVVAGVFGGLFVVCAPFVFKFARKKYSKQSDETIAIDLENIRDKENFAISDKDFQINYSTLNLGEKIGAGAFGEVYRASWGYRDVAVKILLIQGLNKQNEEEFIREARIWYKLRNPNIVQLFGICKYPDPYCMVMPYMVQGDLYSALHSDREISWEIRTMWAREIGAGLEYLHSKDIIHRDLKSPNVLIDDAGHARLADFGLALAKQEAIAVTEEECKETSEKAVGTARWMAPELFNPEYTRGCTKATDVYAYGIILLEISSRKKPFAEARSTAIVASWIKKGHQDQIPQDTPDTISTVINICRKRNPEDRKTMQEVLGILGDTDLYNKGEVERNITPQYDFHTGDPTETNVVLDLSDSLEVKVQQESNMLAPKSKSIVPQYNFRASNPTETIDVGAILADSGIDSEISETRNSLSSVQKNGI